MAVLKEYEEINAKFMDEEILNDPDKMQALMDQTAAVQDRIDALDAWELDTKLNIAMDALRCPPDDQKIESPAENAVGWPCVVCSRLRTCSCWTSRPTTSMPRPLIRWSSTLSATRAPFCASHTTATSSTMAG